MIYGSVEDLASANTNNAVALIYTSNRNGIEAILHME